MAETSIARLEYDAARELLIGTIGNERFQLIAYSGGSRGHKPVAPPVAAKYLHAQANTLMSRLATTPTMKKGAEFVQRGGTLPPGHYICRYLAEHHSFGQCIQLLRTSDAVAIHSPFSPHPIPHGRGNDFFIHGAGPKGSDGCIVPANNAERVRLNKAVKAYSGKVVLRVTHVSYMLPAELGGQLA